MHTQKSNNYNIKEVGIATFPISEHCFKLERWQGPPHVNEVKHCEFVLSFVSEDLSLLIQISFTKQPQQLFFLFTLADSKLT